MFATAIRLFICAFVSLFGWNAKEASAGFIEITKTFGPQSYTFNFYPEGVTVFNDNRSGSFLFDRFDSSNGVLNSVKLSFVSDASANMFGLQTGASSTNFVNGNMRVVYSLTAPGFGLSDNSIFLIKHQQLLVRLSRSRMVHKRDQLFQLL